MAEGQKSPKSPIKRIDFEKQELNVDENKELRQAFNVFDTDGDGIIEIGELIHAVKKLGFLDKHPMIGNMILAQCERLAKTSPKGVDFAQFQDAITVKLGDANTEEGCKAIFDMIDDDSDSTINKDNMRHLARELGETLSVDEIVEMLQRAGNTDEASLNFEDFFEIMNKRDFAV